MLDAVADSARSCGLIDERPDGALDATGYDPDQASQYYRAKRANSGFFWQRFFPKLTVLCHTGSYLWVAASISRGPSNDSPEFAPTVLEGALRVRFDRILADAAFDSERHHEFCREFLGIRSTVIPLNPRKYRTWPKQRYRRQLKRCFPRRIYARRVHAESAFSQDKRQLGPTLRARSDEARVQELMLRVLTHNLMILKRVG